MTFSTMARRLRAGSALPAIALAAISVTSGAFLAAPAAAQDYTSGAVSGTVVDAGKKPVTGATITLHSQSQGQTRTFTTSREGSFAASGLTPGAYDVTIAAPGFDSYSDVINVVAAQSNSLVIPLSKAGANEIVVTGSRIKQDFTKTTQGLNIDVVGLTKDVPVARSITGLILLAPTTNPGVTGFGNVPSIGGSSVAENAYYVNGLNITNPDTYVGSTTIPFDFYKTVDVQTSGYAAEFGRATGGVVNATTKSGSNTPMFAIHGNFEPVFAQANGGLTGLTSKPTNLPKYSTNENESMTFEASGALIKDHLFFYGLFQPRAVNSQVVVPNSGYVSKAKSTTPFYGGKVDAYITPTQHLEFTFFDTTNNTFYQRFKFTPNATNTDGTFGAPTASQQTKTGGFNWVGRYTGNVTDFFQISGAYGINKDAGNTLPGDPNAYLVNDRRTATVGGVSSTISQQTFTSNQIIQTQRKFWRVDGDLRFDLVGHHHIRFGVDNEDNSENKTTTLTGGLPIQYSYRNAYVILTYERLGGAIKNNDRAFYLQDSWEPMLGLTINAGVRDDTFKGYNLSGERYLKMNNNWAARIGFSYTPEGTSKFNFKGNYGRYYIPPAMNLGFRGRDNYFQEAFAYPTGTTAATFPVDPTTGLPLRNFGAVITTLGGSGFNKACPADMSAAPGAPTNGGNFCNVFGNNTQDPAYAKVAPGTKPTAEDEFSASMTYQATPLLQFGIQGVYRKLRNVSEDTDFSGDIYDYYGCGNAVPTGTAAQCTRYDAGNTYYIWNPGSSSLTVRDWVDPTKTVTLTNLKFPKPKRTYVAVTLTADRKDDGVWGIHGSLTWSRSRGNYEGTVKSDAGNSAQADAGATQDYDYLHLTDYSYGFLPNQHSITFKSYGSYHPTKNITLGYGVQVQAPMHGSCQGYNPDPVAAQYGAASFWCGTNLVGTTYTSTAPSPRGTAWKSDWFSTVDLSIRYTVPNTKLVLRADVFNVLNKQAVLQKYAAHESTGAQVDPLYLTPYVVQQPRYARFGFDWQF